MKVGRINTAFIPVVITLENLEEVLYLDGLVGEQSYSTSADAMQDACARHGFKKLASGDVADRISRNLYAELENILEQEQKCQVK